MNLTHPIIVGGGPVGAVLALSLQKKGVPFTMLEARAKGASHSDTRALALSYGSRLILEKLNVWEAVAQKATAIHTIHISQRGGFGRTKLNAADHNMPALGYVLPYGLLTQALDAALNEALGSGQQTSQILYEAIADDIGTTEFEANVRFTQTEETSLAMSPLVVVADGGRNFGDIAGVEKETKEYGHDALVSKVKAELPHNNIAYERFTPTGPMALLPNGARDFSLVWTGEKSKIDALLALDDATFLKQLHAAFGDRVGQFLSIEKRMSFPLKLSRLKSTANSHLVIIGNAAQTMHPVAGQGFNVGLRDAKALADMVINTPEAQWGKTEMLQNYSQLRSRDTRGGLLFTDVLVNLFSNDVVGLSGMRGFGLGALELLQPAKNLLIGKMSYGK
ncbi:FAD-dependent monooxygenase [Methylotenera versatilis]|uniref:FAD-dependent monooxygenase n=1 Tax=Methylotenera versatilis TaxID=1055487 RepID=UPI000646A499|nr:FAD-dependent monooxygenase [Methylotenera versatilis]